MSGRAVEASGDVDVILLDKTGTITYGNRLAASITAAPGRDRGGGGRRPPCCRRIHDETPEGRSIVELARKRLAALGRPAGIGDDAGFAALAATIAEDIPFRAETRTSGVTDDGRHDLLKGASRRHRDEARRACPTELAADADRIADLGATPLVARERGPRPRRHRAQGHRQGRPRRAVRRVPADGHPDRHGHRRQPADGRDHRPGGRRRRLHRPGEARGQDRLHPHGAGRGPPRRDDRRRHQRRPGARPGRRRHGHEQRHVGGQGGGQHGRPRLRPDQAAGGHRDRQAAAHHPRLDHHVLHRQRRGQVLRHRAGAVRERLSRSSTRSTSWVWPRPRAPSSRRSSSTP